MLIIMSIIQKILRKNKINQNKNSVPEKNNSPVQEDTSVNVMLPSELHIELVQANEIRNYEIFQVLTTITATLGAGFVTSYFLTESSAGRNGLGFSAITFGVMAIVFILLAWKYRKRAFSQTIKKSISLVEFRSNKLIKSKQAKEKVEKINRER